MKRSASKIVCIYTENVAAVTNTKKIKQFNGR